MNRIEATLMALVGLALALSLALMLLSADWWMRLNSLHIPDARVGQDIPIVYDREFLRNFTGEWAVNVWKMERGDWQPFCAADGKWNYEARKPAPGQDLAWITNGAPGCEDLPPGEYRVTVNVTANPGRLLSRTASVESNVFKVMP